MRLKRFLTIVFIFVCLIGVCYYSYNVITWKIHIDDNKKIKNEIDKIVNIEPIYEVNEEKEESQEAVKYNINFDVLKEINPDTVAYIKLMNTNIDYAVVKGSDNEYYLRHNFEKKWNVNGWIFSDYHNKFDGTDKNIVVFGHNTKDGSMFGTLKNVLKKEWLEENKNHTLVLVTPTNTYNYQIFSTYEYAAENYYITTQFNSDEEYDEFLKKIKERSLYDFGVTLDKNDRILTLSSCTNDGKKRVVVHAKMIDD